MKRLYTFPEQVTIADVLRIVGLELHYASEKHGLNVASAHEQNSVIREEFEELWDHVKADTGYTDAAFSEAIQLAAMAVKYIIGLQHRRIESDGKNLHVIKVQSLEANR